MDIFLVKLAPDWDHFDIDNLISHQWKATNIDRVLLNRRCSVLTQIDQHCVSMKEYKHHLNNNLNSFNFFFTQNPVDADSTYWEDIFLSGFVGDKI